ncbi:hypothetical protein NDU88_007158 [Pleurodeles waltl]|uniref:Uncharacterized protein n=1 Tax=Pleurodeles waltl TaxID=8319 RepID=A0AAV7N1B5_PLEWA|nr:hypothetical protein NDU88_007158 [Pleurodeles waltl]
MEGNITEPGFTYFRSSPEIPKQVGEPSLPRSLAEKKIYGKCSPINLTPDTTNNIDLTNQARCERHAIRWRMEGVAAETKASNQWELQNGTSGIKEDKAKKTDSMFGSATKQLWCHQQSLVEEELLDDMLMWNNQLYKASTESNSKHHFPINKTLINLRLLNLKLMHCNYQDNLLNRTPEHLSISEVSADDDSDTEYQEIVNGKAIMYRNEAKSEQEHDLSVMKLLAQCHLKLEELEGLKHSSKELTKNLCDAKESIAYLRQKVAELESENSQKEAEINVLAVELTESKSLLREKSYEMAHVKMLVRNLRKQLQKKQRELARKSQTEAKCPDPEHTKSYSERSRHQGGCVQPRSEMNNCVIECPESEFELSGNSKQKPGTPGTKNSNNSSICSLF